MIFKFQVIFIPTLATPTTSSYHQPPLFYTITMFHVSICYWQIRKHIQKKLDNRKESERARFVNLAMITSVTSTGDGQYSQFGLSITVHGSLTAAEVLVFQEILCAKCNDGSLIPTIQALKDGVKLNLSKLIFGLIICFYRKFHESLYCSDVNISKNRQKYAIMEYVYLQRFLVIRILANVMAGGTMTQIMSQVMTPGTTVVCI